MLRTLGVSLSLLGAAGIWISAAVSAPTDGRSAVEQVSAADSVYAVQCGSCHGSDMQGGQFGPAIRGASFAAKWKGRRSELLKFVSSQMPPGSTGALSDSEYAQV